MKNKLNKTRALEILLLAVKVFTSNDPKMEQEALQPNHQKCVLLAGQSRKWETVNMSMAVEILDEAPKETQESINYLDELVQSIMNGHLLRK